MKRRIRLISAAVMMLCIGHAASAQDVDGIALWDKCTKEQLIEKYGQPISYSSQEDDELGFGMIEEIRFKDVHFSLIGNRVLSFSLESTVPRAMTKYIKGGIKIGDSEEMTKKLESFYDRKEIFGDMVCYIYYFKDSPFTIVTKNGKIIKISASVNIT